MYGLVIKLKLKRIDIDRALFRVNAGADAVANDDKKYIRDIPWCVTSIDPSNDNRIIVQKGLKNILVLVFMKERPFIRMYPMLQTS